MDEGSYGSYELFIPAGVIGPGNSTVTTVVYGAASTVYTGSWYKMRASEHILITSASLINIFFNVQDIICYGVKQPVKHTVR